MSLALGFLNFLKVSGAEINQTMEKFSKEDNHKVWDPANDFNFSKVKKNAAIILTKFDKLKEDPKKPGRIYRKAWMWSIFIFAIVAFLSYFFGLVQLFIFAIIILIMAPITVQQYFKSLSIDLIKIDIAKDNNWYYDPMNDYAKWNSMKVLYPELFNKGNERQNLEDQFWGQTTKGGKTYDFYSALFHYTIVTRNSKGGSSRHEYHNNFFAIKLNKNIKTRFFLYPENFGSKISNFFTRKEINTESVEFNKEFAFSYDGKKGEQAQEIVKTLSPAVQNQLLELKRKKGKFNVIFCHDTVIFMFEGVLFKKVYTNFLKGVEIDSRDRDAIQGHLSTLIDISANMVKYFD
jgi:hypothetical protein